MAREWQFDGLVGPTHNYAGLAHGNVAAQSNAGAVSNPRAAALQGLEKMHFVRSLGVPQAFLPPHFRPLLSELKRLGFRGDTGTILSAADAYSPSLLAAIYSSSFMWTANAATITPSCDAGDGKLHLTPSNMTSHFHRIIESDFSQKVLRMIFHNPELYCVHNHLCPQDMFGDEGAANHMLCSPNHGIIGTHVFAYGESHKSRTKPAVYPARQKRMASEAIARSHGIPAARAVYLQQEPTAIDQGVFHNDVIAMNTTRRMIVHAEAFIPEHQQILQGIAKKQDGMVYREIKASELSVADAVSTYFFNSQLLDLGGDRFALIAPGESEAHPAANALLRQLQSEGVLTDVHYRDLRESMRNGGGPACLRLRVQMTPEEEAGIHSGVILTDARYEALKQWVSTHYRDRLRYEDLKDPQFVTELETAYRALEPIIGMTGLYAEAIAANAA